MAISEKQRIANIRNSKYSTGPKTKSGKELVRHNAITHGLCSEALMLDGNEREEFKALSRSICKSLQPSEGLEAILAERMIIALWRLKRVVIIENFLLSESDVSMNDIFRLKKRKLGDFFVNSKESIEKLTRYERHLETTFYKASRELSFLKDLGLEGSKRSI